MLSLIAAIGKNRELGKNGQLLFHAKEDMAFFKQTTLNHGILMGRKTFDSIGRPLPKRTNFVVTRHPELLPDGVEPVKDLRQFLESYQETEEELFVIGGGMVYFEALPYAKNLYLTEFDASDPDADAFFPAFNPSEYTKSIIRKGSENGLNYTIAKYTRR